MVSTLEPRSVLRVIQTAETPGQLRLLVTLSDSEEKGGMLRRTPKTGAKCHPGERGWNGSHLSLQGSSSRPTP